MSAVLHSKNKDFCAKKGSQQIKWSTKNHHEKLRCVTNEGENWETLGTSFKQEPINSVKSRRKRKCCQFSSHFQVISLKKVAT